MHIFKNLSRSILPLLLFVAFTNQLYAQNDSLVKVDARLTSINDSTYRIQYTISVNEGWQVYGQTLSSDALTDTITAAPHVLFNLETIRLKGATQFSVNPIQQKDELFEKAYVFPSGAINAFDTIVIKGFKPDTLSGKLLISIAKGTEFYQQEIPVNIFLAEGKKAEAFQMIIPNLKVKKDETDKGLLAVFILGFLGGLIALITPCVFPMIPVTVSFFTKRSKTRKQGIKNGLLYGLSILLIYVLASAPFHIIGNIQPEVYNKIATSALLNIIFFVIFIFFSISFFGFFEITLPSGIANKADAKSGLGSFGGIFFMAITLAIVSFSCTGPILGTLLVSSLQGGAWALTYGMAGFGVALALPFTLFAIFPQWLSSLPKSGGWLDTVKKVLAFLELALAFKFLSTADNTNHWGLLKREVFIGIWAIITIGLALYLFGKLRLPHDVKGTKISLGRKLFGTIAVAFSAVLIMGIFPKNAFLLKFLSGFPPPASYSFFADKKDIHSNVINDYEKALSLSKEQNKPILIDFTGWACVNCRKMEENVWTDPAVSQFLRDNFILVSLYVDDRELLPVEKRFKYTTKSGVLKEINTVGDLWATFQAENFNQVTQPLYVVLSPDQHLLSDPVGYTPNVKDYLDWLKSSIDKKK
jgi:thiol:disulfide interchange protein DsbD